MTETPVALAFFDPDRELYGSARSGATVIFQGRTPTAMDGPSVEPSGEGFRATLPDHMDLELEPVSPEAQLGGIVARTCRVRGEVEGARVDCLGTLSQTRSAPKWDELDAIRTVSVLLDDRNAMLAVARRPRGAPGHGQELVVAALIQDGELLNVEDTRISTVYDGEGRQRSAGLELWLPGEDFPRRGSGEVVAGSSLELEGLRVHAAVFRWRLEERDGYGAYELMVREPAPSAA